MSVSSEVQRTLVKSPPELWAELSNPDALSRHLSKLGEIRITRVEPETKVEWEAEGACGVVHLKQSGWGTKVTLSLTRETPVSEEPEPERIAEPELVTRPEPKALIEAAPEPKQVAQPEPIAESEPVAEPEPKAKPIRPEPELAAAEPVPEPIAEAKRGFFARLLRRLGPKLVEVVEPETQPQPIADAGPEPELQALAAPEPIYPARPVEPAPDLGAELESLEAQMAEETTELLTGVLDRLGAAHHRPFSRG
jgi:hypothetical protein